MKNLLLIFLLASSSTLLESAITKRSPDKDSSLFGVDDRDGSTDNEAVGFKKSNETVGFLPLPPGYNKLIIPLGNVSNSIFIMVHLSIREVLDVNTNDGLLELDTELGVTWIDWEIWKYFIEDKEAQEKAKSGPEEIILDAEFLKYIWKPDIFIEEMAAVDRTFLLSKLITLRFLVRNKVMPGAITFKSRQTFKVRCDMDFQFYPADTQKCSLNIRSYSYSEDKLFLVWNPHQRIFLDQIEDSNYDFQVSNVEPGEELYDLFTLSQSNCCSKQNFSTLTFTLQLRRNLTYHLVQTCLPSVLLILITWLCFLLPPDMVEVRIGISMTTLLTLTAMFTAVREQAPEVSYTMAIDIWMVFCIFFIFIALVLFTMIYWMRRRLKRGRDEQEVKDRENANGDVPHLSGVEKTDTYRKVVGHTKRYAFWLFAFIFIAFLVVYARWLFQSSEYLNWSPSSKYNALPLENGNDSNRLFTKKEKLFRANSTKKVVESQFRFNDIFKQVIYPRIQKLHEGESEAGAEEYYEEEEETTTTFDNLNPALISQSENGTGRQ